MNRPIRPIEWCGDRLRLLDQRVLPHEEQFIECRSAADVAAAIRNMVVRGAPAIGVAAAFGMALAARNGQDLNGAAQELVQARPTAVNLKWAVERLRSLPRHSIEEVAGTMYEEDIATNKRIGGNGAALLPQSCTILTHCNAGALAMAGYGTALGVVRAAHEQRKLERVFATETRPWLQGARLTMWECAIEGIPATLIADSAAAMVMRDKKVDAVIVGADRIAANGDTANKIGTYQLAIAARAHGIPFYVAAPTSTIDRDSADGSAIPIEERGAEELTHFRGAPVAPASIEAYNPVFDVTPRELITAIITEDEVWRPE